MLGSKTGLLRDLRAPIVAGLLVLLVIFASAAAGRRWRLWPAPRSPPA